MEKEQTTTADTLPGQSALSQVQPRKAKRRVISTAYPKAWLVVFAALSMVVLEGAFRKWVPPFGGGMWKYLMYFSKDIIFALVLLFPVRSLPSQPLTVFQNWLLPGCALLGLGALASSVYGLNLVGAVLTTRAAIVLPIIALLAVPRLGGLPLRRVALLLAFWTVLNFALGVEQNRLSPDSFLNRYSETGMQIVDTESGVRATGTFSYITGIEILSSVGIWAGLVLLGLARNLWQRIGAWAALAAGVGCGLVSVSRAPLVIGAAMVAGWLFLSRDGITVAVKGLVAAAFCAVIATGLGITPVFSDLTQGLTQRWDTAGDSFNQRAFGQFGETVTALQMAPLGHGYGTQQVGGVYAATGQAGFNGFESPLPRLVMETGALGLLGYLLVCAGAILALQRAKREAQSEGARAALLATQMLLLPMFYGNLIFDHTASAFVWLIFAAVLAGVAQSAKGGVHSGKQPSEVADTKLHRPRKAENRKQPNEIGGATSRAEEDRGRRPEDAPHSVTRNQTLKS